MATKRERTELRQHSALSALLGYEPLLRFPRRGRAVSFSRWTIGLGEKPKSKENMFRTCLGGAGTRFVRRRDDVQQTGRPTTHAAMRRENELLRLLIGEEGEGLVAG